VPQIQFNDDGVWHEFAPNGAALKAGPWFPFVQLSHEDVRINYLSVHRPRATKSAGNVNKTPAASAAACSADVAVDGGDMSTSLQQTRLSMEED
jgi:hypothetical protein